MIPPTTDLPWTPELTDLVERLWMEGKSSNQIGRMIGKTRNAVIGKVHRMGLISAHRQQPTLARVYNSPPPAPPKPPKPRAEPVRSPPAAIKENVVPLPPRPPPKPPDGGLSLLSLQYGIHCAYPVSGGGADLVYCGGETGGGRYCEVHRQVMYDRPKAAHSSSTYRRK